MRTGKLFHDLVEGFFGAAAADVGRCTRTQAFGELAAELDLAFSLGLSEGLRVGVRDDKLDAFKLGRDHVVDGVSAGTSDTEHGDSRTQFS